MYAPPCLRAPRFENMDSCKKNIRSTSMAQANTYSIVLTNNEHGKRELETHIKSFINRK